MIDRKELIDAIRRYLLVITAITFSLFVAIHVGTLAVCQEFQETSSKKLEVIPALPTTIRCEVNEEIQFYSKLTGEARWKIFPDGTATLTQAGIKGLKTGSALLCGKDGAHITIIPVSVELLTPDEHTILTDLRKELSKSNLLRNHLRDADIKLNDAKAKRNTIAPRFTDINIAVKRAISDCDTSYSAMQQAADRFRSAKNDISSAFEWYNERIKGCPEYKSKIEKHLLGNEKSPTNEYIRLLLPAGFRIGAFIVPASGMTIDESMDWSDILKFESINRPSLATEKERLYVALSLYEEARNELVATAGSYIDDVVIIAGLLSEQDKLPEVLKTVQRDLDIARKDKLGALYESKENGRRVEELQLFYQFRKWIESRTVVGFVDASDIFGVDTDPFKERLTAYRAFLEDSLVSVDRKGDTETATPAMPDLCTLPSQDILKNLPATDNGPKDIAFPDKQKLLESIFGFIPLDETAEILLKCDFNESSTGRDRTNINMSSPIPPYAIADGILSEVDIEITDLPSLNPYRISDIAEPELVSFVEPDSREIVRDRHIPSLHNLDSEVTKTRDAVFSTFKSAMDKYNEQKASFDDTFAAKEYRKAAERSLETTNSIDSYLDWRIFYIRLVHGGETTRMIEFDKLLKNAGRNGEFEVTCFNGVIPIDRLVSIDKLQDFIRQDESSWVAAQGFLVKD